MRIIFTLSLLLIALCVPAAKAAQPDGEEVYRQNCRRCHTAIHTFTTRVMATVVHHMQVRAMLTRSEEAAVLQYLLETSPAHKPVGQHSKKGPEKTDP